MKAERQDVYARVTDQIVKATPSVRGRPVTKLGTLEGLALGKILWPRCAGNCTMSTVAAILGNTASCV